MNTASNPFVGWTALIGGAVGVVSFVALVLLFVVGEPFGTLNDLLATPSALLMIPLIVALYRINAVDRPMLSLLAMLAGSAGFAAAAVGGLLLVLGRISFEQSLLPGIGGFGLIGLWVLLNSALGLANGRLPSGVAWLGVALGLTPTLALFMMTRADRVAALLVNMGNATAGFQAGPLVYVSLALGFISYAGLPVWFILMGRLFLSGRLVMLSAPVAVS
jgi:hypothetical protein